MIIDILPKPPECYIKNCIISPRRDEGVVFSTGSGGVFTDDMFFVDENVIYPRLDGYAIVPREEYQDLIDFKDSVQASSDIAKKFIGSNVSPRSSGSSISSSSSSSSSSSKSRTWTKKKVTKNLFKFP